MASQFANNYRWSTWITANCIIKIVIHTLRLMRRLLLWRALELATFFSRNFDLTSKYLLLNRILVKHTAIYSN